MTEPSQAQGRYKVAINEGRPANVTPNMQVCNKQKQIACGFLDLDFSYTPADPSKQLLRTLFYRTVSDISGTPHSQVFGLVSAAF
ncbi:hypothetical protein ACET3Z_006410 [Daucus carota]